MHYRILMRVENEDARNYYFNECAEVRWSTRVLQRQIDTQFYERLVRNNLDRLPEDYIFELTSDERND